MKITISYQEYKQGLIDEAHRLMIKEAIAQTDNERKQIRAKIQACGDMLDRLEIIRPKNQEEPKKQQEQEEKQLEDPQEEQEEAQEPETQQERIGEDPAQQTADS